MQVLIDGNGLQAAVHIGTYTSLNVKPAVGKRLSTFLSIIEDLGCEVAFTEGKSSEITPDLLGNSSVLVITTRMSSLPKPSEFELETIQNYVQQGGGLLVMSNHPWPNSPNSIPDIHTASLFGVSLHGPMYCRRKLLRKFIRIAGKDLRAHSITEKLKKPIMYRNGCRISSGRGDILAVLPGEKSELNAFAVAIDGPQTGDGRVVITSDSGFIGNDDTNFPGQGLINKGGNMQFIRQVFQWLLKQR